MSFLDAVRTFLAIEPMQMRTVDPWVEVPTLEAQLAALRAQARPWRQPTITEALGVPAIQRAVTLIANTTGSLSIQGWRNGVPMAETPRVITRPDPYQTPRDSYRDMAYCMATRGETVLWIASRDANDQAQALIVVPLHELDVEENERNRLFPVYTWGKRKGTRFSAANPTGEFVHITYLKEPGALRGIGPLQLAGAASSVSVEAQEWAANFYASGGYPSVVLRSAVQLTAEEAGALKEQWAGTPSNMPKVTDPGIEEVKEFNVNPQGAQMLDSREHQNGEAARMFGIPGSLMEYGSPGSSLTYQNLADVWVQFVRGCLAPNYLEPIEQALSDLLPRSQVARFAVAGLERADVKTRWEVYGMAATVLGADEAAAYAREKEGLAPGDVEMAPVPFAPASAVPASLPQLRTSGEVRCPGKHPRRNERCNALLAEAPPFTGRCWRCGMAHAEAATAVGPDDARFRRLEDAVAAFASREPAGSTMTIAEGAIQIRNEAPPPTNVTIAEGAIQVTTPDVRNEISVTTPEVRNEITVEPATVEPTPVEITNSVNVEPTPVAITVEPASPTPVEVRNEVSVEPAPVTVISDPPRKTTKRVVRDNQNQITEIIEESTDG